MSVWEDCHMILQRVNTKIDSMKRLTFYIRHAYGKVGISGCVTNTDITPLMTRRQLLFWLEAFESGMDYANDESQVTP